MKENELYRYWLSSLYQISSIRMNKIRSRFGTAKELFDASPELIEKARILTDRERIYLNASRNKEKLKEEYFRLQSSGIKLCTVEDSDYPSKLKKIEDPPYGLFYLGKLPDEDRLCVSVIGSRSCSNYGIYCAESIVKDLVRYKVQIISGMAYGIDSLAQKTAIKNHGYSLAVLGTGVNVCYPKSEYSLYRELTEKGGVISEFPPDTEANSWHFPLRNRIISGISDAVLVIEAGEKSGTLITVDRALEQGRDIFAVPGRINDKLSYRCNWLIKQGAYIATNAEDILEILKKNFISETENKQAFQGIFMEEKEILGLESDEKLVYSIICFDDICIDDIIRKVDLSLYKVSSICTKLVLKGYIREVGKGRFIRNS